MSKKKVKTKLLDPVVKPETEADELPPESSNPPGETTPPPPKH